MAEFGATEQIDDLAFYQKVNNSIYIVWYGLSIWESNIYSFFSIFITITNGFIFTVFLMFILKYLIKTVFKDVKSINKIALLLALIIVILL